MFCNVSDEINRIKWNSLLDIEQICNIVYERLSRLSTYETLHSHVDLRCNLPIAFTSKYEHNTTTVIMLIPGT